MLPYQVKPSNPQNLVQLAQELNARWAVAKSLTLANPLAAPH
jgi:hypothetical protein